MNVYLLAVGYYVLVERERETGGELDEDEEVVFIWRLRLHAYVISLKGSTRGLGTKGQSFFFV